MSVCVRVMTLQTKEAAYRNRDKRQCVSLANEGGTVSVDSLV